MSPVKKTTTKTTKTNSDKSAIDFAEQIRCRAYELYERRGHADGRDIDDWLQAEAELLIERAKPLAGAAAKNNREPPSTSTGKPTAQRVKKPREPAQT